MLTTVAPSAVAAFYAMGVINKALDGMPQQVVVKCFEYLRDIIPHKTDVLRKEDLEKLSPAQADSVVKKVKAFAKKLVTDAARNDMGLDMV